MDNLVISRYKIVIAQIGRLRWTEIDSDELIAAATAYYYFSIQFRENLTIAASMFPDDQKLAHLMSEECDTDNLSPWPAVAAPDERMNHDEFMRRALSLSTLPEERAKATEAAGLAYLHKARLYPPAIRASSIASYEDGGLETTFNAMLTAPSWNNPTLRAFRHFLVKHIHFDADPTAGHGALSRHLPVDDRILPLWEDFRDLLICAVPRLSTGTAPSPTLLQ